MNPVIINAKASVMNMPDHPLGTGYLVVRLCDMVLWYYGFYDSYERAFKAAGELGNGFVLGVVSKEDLSMVSEFYEISKDDYDKAQKDGAESIISDAIKWGYGVYGAKVKEIEGKYYLSYSRGNSCD